MKKLITFLVGFSFLCPHMARASEWRGYLLNKEGLNQFQAESYGESAQSFLKALETEPMNPLFHLNLGMALFAMDEPQRAAQAFENAHSLSSDSEIRFIALFNQAASLAQAKDIAKALMTYQKALEIDPENLEVKTNIELLTANQDQEGGGDGQNDPKGQEGDSKSDQKEDQSDQPDQGEQEQKPKPKSKPQEFKGKDLSPADVKKILEELKSQEQGIRAKDYEKGTKERPSGNDW